MLLASAIVFLFSPGYILQFPESEINLGKPSTGLLLYAVQGSFKDVLDLCIPATLHD